MPDQFSIRTTPHLDAPTDALNRTARSLGDLSEFWPAVGRSIADQTQAAWPLKRRSGRLRRSLSWSARGGLGKAGIYEAKSDSLVIGSSLFLRQFSPAGDEAFAEACAAIR